MAAKMLTLGTIVLALSLCTSRVTSSPDFLFTIPRTLRAGGMEQYCMTYLGQSMMDAEQVEYGVTLEPDELNTTYSIYQPADMNGEHSRCKKFLVPPLDGKYTLTLYGVDALSGMETFRHTAEVTVEGSALITFVQTDKPIYQPGQTVKFRLLSLTKDLMPKLERFSEVIIQDPKNIRVGQWLDLDATEGGMVSLEFPLSADPVLGEWKITARMAGEDTIQTFKVEEYVLPKFEVTITPPTFLLPTDPSIEGKVCAKYTYGKPVKGSLLLKGCMENVHRYYYYSPHEEESCYTLIADVNGCYQFTLNATAMGFVSRRAGFSLYSKRLRLNATVIEDATGVDQSAKSEGPEVTYDPLKLEFKDDSNKFFKPGFPYRGQVLVTRPDGTPASGEIIEVIASSWNSDYGWKSSLHMGKNITSDENGVVDFALTSLTMDHTYVSLTARAVEYETDYSHSYKDPFYILNTPRGYSSIKQWYSPSQSYIFISPVEGTVTCNSDVTVDVYYSTPPDTFYKFHYMVMTRGRVVFDGHKTHHFKIHDSMDFLTVDESQLLNDLPPPSHYDAPPEPPVVDMAEELDDGEIEDEDDDDDNDDDDDDDDDDEEAEMGEDRKPVEEELIVPEVFQPLGVRRKRETAEGTEAGASDEPEAEPPVSEEEEVVKATHISHFQLTIPVTTEMGAGSRLLVYFIREDQETVASGISFDVEECFENKVSMVFEQEELRPGQVADIRLTAQSGSLCSVGVVDKSINILGGDHQITPRKIYDALKKFDTSSPGYYSYYFEDKDYCKKKIQSRLEEEGKEDEEVEKDYYYNYFRSDVVDSIQAFRDMGLLVFTNLRLETRPCTRSVRSPMPVYSGGFMRTGLGGVPGPQEQAVTVLDMDGSVDKVVDGPNKQANIRSYFPETWLWDLHLIGESGEVVLSHEIPHTITEWVGNSLCTHPTNGVGVSPVTSIRAFQPFFLSFTLPYAAVRGETIPLLVTVFNYMTECLTMQVSLTRSEGFDFAEGSEWRSEECVCGGESATIRYLVVPFKLGKIEFLASAESMFDDGTCGNRVVSETGMGVTDAVKRELLVEAEGIEMEYTFNSYICTEDSRMEENIDLPLPADMIPDSQRGKINIIGDIMGAALANLKNLLQMPYGCGEQNMATFAPNIFVLQYLTNTNQLRSEIENEAKNYMRSGYQRQLKYRHSDGSYSAFGDRDTSGSTWLTAFVVKCLALSRPFIYIDAEDLEKSIMWFREQHLETGCFPKVGSVHSKSLKGGQAEGTGETALTAFVVIAMLEAGIDRQDPRITQAIQCLDAQDITDTYTVALTAYAYTLYDLSSQKRKFLMAELERRAKGKTDGVMHWSSEDKDEPAPTPSRYFWYYRAPSAEVEMTAYALMAYISGQQSNAAVIGRPIVLWLTKQRNSLGGFSSTQDTVVALQALAKYAALVYKGGVDLTVRVTGDSMDSEFRIDDMNTLLLQKEDIPVIPNNLGVSVEGRGCALIQANVKYNIPESEADSPPFDLNVNVYRSKSHRNDCRRRTLNICAKYTGADGVSNMAVVEVKMVTGWIPVKSTVREVMDNLLIDVKKYEIDRNYIHFYFDQLDSSTRCFFFDVEQAMEISHTKPAMTKVYDYYDTDMSVLTQYKIKTICGTKEELPFITDEEYRMGMIEGAEIMQVRVPDSRMVPPPAPESFNRLQGCPRCMTSIEDLETVVCNSAAIYKAHAGRTSFTYPVKIKANLREKQKKSLNSFLYHKIGPKCDCDLLENIGKVLIFATSSSVFNDEGQSLYMDMRSTVIPWSHPIERQLRKMVLEKCGPPK